MNVLFIGTGSSSLNRVMAGLRLRWPDTQAAVATKAREGINVVKRESPDVVILQPDLPDMSLPDVISEIRQFSEAPLVVLGKEQEELALQALQLGADD